MLNVWFPMPQFQSDIGFLSVTGSFMSQFCMTQGAKMLDIQNHQRLTWVSISQDHCPKSKRICDVDSCADMQSGARFY